MLRQVVEAHHHSQIKALVQLKACRAVLRAHLQEIQELRESAAFEIGKTEETLERMSAYTNVIEKNLAEPVPDEITIQMFCDLAPEHQTEEVFARIEMLEQRKNQCLADSYEKTRAIVLKFVSDKVLADFLTELKIYQSILFIHRDEIPSADLLLDRVKELIDDAITTPDEVNPMADSFRALLNLPPEKESTDVLASLAMLDEKRRVHSQSTSDAIRESVVAIVKKEPTQISKVFAHSLSPNQQRITFETNLNDLNTLSFFSAISRKLTSAMPCKMVDLSSHQKRMANKFDFGVDVKTDFDYFTTDDVLRLLQFFMPHYARLCTINFRTKPSSYLDIHTFLYVCAQVRANEATADHHVVMKDIVQKQLQYKLPKSYSTANTCEGLMEDMKRKARNR